MLKPGSFAFIGITEGRGMKLGLGLPVDPLMDSDAAMSRYLELAKEQGDTLELLREDEESLPAVERRWRLEPFGDADLVDLCANAWHRMGAHMSEVMARGGIPGSVPQLDCRHELEKIRVRAYSREALRAGKVDGFLLL